MTSAMVSRFTDISGEPLDILMPIQGYENEPLLPLSETVKPISRFFAGIEKYVTIASLYCQRPADSLSPDESAAIHLYTMQFDREPSLYFSLNRCLRAKNRQELQPWFLFLKLFLTALHKLPSQSRIVWRGAKNVDLSCKYKTGTSFAWWGVSSCTTSIAALESEEFLGKTGERTLFSIECINGKSIEKHSYVQNTEEVILMPGTYFQVIAQLHAAPQLDIIHLKEITPPFQLLVSPFSKSTHMLSASVMSKPITDSQSRSHMIKQDTYPDVPAKKGPLKSTQTIDDQLAEDNFKVANATSNSSQFRKQKSTDSINSSMSRASEHRQLIRKLPSENFEASAMENTLDESAKGQSDCLINFQFVLIDILKRLNEPALSMFKSLHSIIGESIIIVHNNSIFNFDQLPKKITFIFVSSQFVATLKSRSKLIKAIFILEDDKNKVDQQERFGNGEDLICQLADEIFRCYQKEANDHIKSGDLSLANIQIERAHNIHNKLWKVQKQYSVNNKTTRASTSTTTTTLLWLKYHFDQDHHVVEEVNKLFSNVISSFRVFGSQLHCSQYLLKSPLTDAVFLIIDNDYENSIVSDFHQFSIVKEIYRYGKPSLDNEIVIDNSHDLCFRLTHDLLVHYNKLGTQYSASHDATTASNMFTKAHELCNIFANITLTISKDTFFQMKTISDIKFDKTIFSQVRHSVILLYQMEGTHLAIPLPNVHLMSFIQVFQNMNECQRHLITNSTQEMTLFVYEDNIEWLIMNSYFSHIPKLRKINIFCSSPEQQQRWTVWTERFRKTIDEPFIYQELDFKLLLTGSKYLEQVCPQLKQDDGVSNLLKKDQKDIWRALAQYFLTKANTENERDKRSEETRS